MPKCYSEKRIQEQRFYDIPWNLNMYMITSEVYEIANPQCMILLATEAQLSKVHVLAVAGF